MSVSRFWAGALALGLCIALSAVSAAAVTQIPQPLPLDAALAWAQQYNPAVRAAALRVERLGGEAMHADAAVPSNLRLELRAFRPYTAGRSNLTVVVIYTIVPREAIASADSAGRFVGVCIRFTPLLDRAPIIGAWPSQHVLETGDLLFRYNAKIEPGIFQPAGKTTIAGLLP